jgi:hypothetical protein
MDCGAPDNKGVLNPSIGFAVKNWIGEIAGQGGTAIFRRAFIPPSFGCDSTQLPLR